MMTADGKPLPGDRREAKRFKYILSFIVSLILRGRYNDNTHFTDKETKMGRP